MCKRCELNSNSSLPTLACTHECLRSLERASCVDMLEDLGWHVPVSILGPLFACSRRNVRLAPEVNSTSARDEPHALLHCSTLRDSLCAKSAIQDQSGSQSESSQCFLGIEREPSRGADELYDIFGKYGSLRQIRRGNGGEFVDCGFCRICTCPVLCSCFEQAPRQEEHALSSMTISTMPGPNLDTDTRHFQCKAFF